MATIRQDLKNGHRLVTRAAGTEIIRTYYVSGLTGDPEDQLIEAVSDPGIPLIGEAYPNPQTTARCIALNASPGGENGAIVEAVYSTTAGSTFDQPAPVGDGEDVKQFSSGLETSRTVQDRDGTAMVIAAPAGYESWGSYISEASYQKPVHNLLFERSESAPPNARSRDMVGHTNSAVLGNYPANSLLFARLDAQSDDGGRVWRVTYEFQYSTNLWRHYDVWHSPQGKVPSGAGPGTVWHIYPEANFSLLGLDFSDSQSPV